MLVIKWNIRKLTYNAYVHIDIKTVTKKNIGDILEFN